MKRERCGKEFEPKRKDARYCSTPCRVKAARLSVTKNKISVTKDRLSVTSDTDKPKNDTYNDKSVTDKPGTVTDNVTDKLSVTTPIIEDGHLRLPDHYQYHAPGKDNRDNPHHPDYDLSESGFKRRNKNWMEFCKPFRESMMAAGKRIHDARVNG